jgi:hypothetical protein
VRQLKAAPRLPLQLAEPRALQHHDLGQKLQGDFALQFSSRASPDNPHASTPENFEEAVAAKQFLATGKLAQGGVGGIARALGSHARSVSIIEMRRKFKR